MTEENNKIGFQALWEKKVPQYVGSYFAIGFGLLQFLNFIIGRYDLSENLVDKYMLVWFALLPAIVILIYFGGKLSPITTKGKLKWPKFAVIGNLVLALLLGGLLFNGEAKAAEQAEVLQLTNEEGDRIEAVVPSLNKVKSVACFQFENKTGDVAQEWWSTAFSYLLQLDLNQRPEFYAESQFELHRFYNRLGLEPLKLPNVGMLREIARKSRSDYFTNISYSFENNTCVLTGNLYSSKDGKSIIELKASNEDPYAAIDEIKQQIFDNIPNPLEKVQNEVNLPASALVSANQEALKNIVLSTNTFLLNPTAMEEATRLAQNAVDLDPTCSICSLGLGGAIFALGRQDEAVVHITNAVKYGAALPERMQFGAKELLYGLTNKTEASIKLQELRRKMFPYDFQPYERLLPIYMVNYGIDSTKVLLQEAIDNGNIEKGLLALYDLQVQDEDYLEAEKTLQKFSSAFPDREQDKMKFADIYEKQGKLDKARELYLEEETMDPLKTSIQTSLAYLDFRDLAMYKANTRIDKGLQQATTLADSLSYIWTKGYLLRMSGQINKSLESYDTYEAQGIRQMPLTAMIPRTFFAKSELYQSIGQPERVKEIITKLEKYSPESALIYDCLAITNLIERDYFEDSNTVQLSCREQFKTLGEGFLEYYDLLTAYVAKDYEKCLETLNQDNGKIRKLFDQKRYFLVNIYIKSGEIAIAKDLLQRTIDQKPDDPIYYYLMATLLENENKKEATENLNIALKYWANADEEYIPLQKAKQLAERLSIYDATKS